MRSANIILVGRDSPKLFPVAISSSSSVRNNTLNPLRSENVGGHVGGHVGGQSDTILSERQILISSLIKTNPKVSAKQMSEVLSVTTRTYLLPILHLFNGVCDMGESLPESP